MHDYYSSHLQNHIPPNHSAETPPLNHLHQIQIPTPSYSHHSTPSLNINTHYASSPMIPPSHSQDSSQIMNVAIRNESPSSIQYGILPLTPNSMVIMGPHSTNSNSNDGVTQNSETIENQTAIYPSWSSTRASAPLSPPENNTNNGSPLHHLTSGLSMHSYHNSTYIQPSFTAHPGSKQFGNLYTSWY